MDYQAIDDLSERLCRDLELRKEPSRGTSGRALLISWANELSTEQDNLLDNLRCILRDDYRYTVERLHLSGSAHRDLQSKVLDLLEQSQTSKKPAVIYYHGAVSTTGDTWVSKRNRRNTVSWTRLERSVQQSPAEALVFVDRLDTLSQRDMEVDDNSVLSLHTDVSLDSVQGKLELIDSHRAAATEALSFISQLSKTLQQPQDGCFNAQALFRHLHQQEGMGSLEYRNLSSSEDGESLLLKRIAASTSVITFTFDITITTNLEATTLKKQIFNWCVSSPPVVRAMGLSTHRSAKKMGEGELTNLLTLRVEALHTESTMSSLAQWSKQAPDRLLVTPGRPFHARAQEPARPMTKSIRVSNDLTAWVEQRNQSLQLTAASSTRQGEYRNVLVVTVRWRDCDFDAEKEIGLLRSVLNDNFKLTIEPDLVLLSDDGAQSQLEDCFRKYTHPIPNDALASQDLLIVIYDGHGADGLFNNTDMIFAPNPRKSATKVNWTPIARDLDRAACDVLQILDCCYAATATKSSGGHKDTEDRLGSIHDGTANSDYRGTNEYLSSSSRDSEAHGGNFISMQPFADELLKLARKGKEFTVREWHHCIDSAIFELNKITTADPLSPKLREERGFSSPVHKIQPKERLENSIILQPNSLDSSRQRDLDAEGDVYAKVRVVDGREAEIVYFTEEQMKKQLS